MYSTLMSMEKRFENLMSVIFYGAHILSFQYERSLKVKFPGLNNIQKILISYKFILMTHVFCRHTHIDALLFFLYRNYSENSLKSTKFIY